MAEEPKNYIVVGISFCPKVRCGGCGEWFKPDMVETTVLPSGTTAPASDELSEAERVSNLARGLVGWSIFFLVAGLLCLLADAIFALLGGGADLVTVLCLTGAGLGLAFWFFLVGQIVHIRALLAREKGR